MLSSVYAILAAVLLVLPGFIVADLAETRRARPADRSAWELVLRALAYAVVIQTAAALAGWTPQLLEGLDRESNYREHVDAVALYLLVTILVVPTLAGLSLSWFLRRAEQRGQLSTVHYALGGRDARFAWDYIFQRYGSGFVLVTLKEDNERRPQFLLAKFGRGSWATMSPAAGRDVYFEEVWPASSSGHITEQYVVPRGMWLPIDHIESIQFADPPPPRPERAAR